MPTSIDRLYREIEPPYGGVDREVLGGELGDELAATSLLWMRCGYRPGICAYLNFFLLVDFIVAHDAALPSRFASFRSMARSFQRTDEFARAVTDSGRRPSGGISAAGVRDLLAAIMARHAALSIPAWMMTYFGFSLVENVEKQCAPLGDDQRCLHRAYMAKAFRLMGIPFSPRTEPMEAFARAVEERQAGVAPQLERHARNILRLAEMVGVSSAPASILPMLPPTTRAVFEPLAARLRPGPVRRLLARGLGCLIVPKAVGSPRAAVLADQAELTP